MVKTLSVIVAELSDNSELCQKKSQFDERFTRLQCMLFYTKNFVIICLLKRRILR